MKLPDYRISLKAAMLACVLAMPAGKAQAELPEPVRAMIDAAIEAGDEDTIRAVIDLARATNPDDAGEVDAILAAYETDLAAAQALEAAEEEAAIRNGGLFDNWSGRGELGAFNSTGNAENTGLTASLALTREGINWRHKLRGRADYQEANGVTTREQFLAAYEPNLKLSPRLFAFALAQYERDRFQGFSARYSLSGGLGYEVIDRDDLSLSIQAGPAYRQTERINDTTDSSLAGLASADFDWQISERIALTQDLSAFIESGNSTYVSDTGLQAGISDRIKVRLSYTVEHDTDPPPGAENTDTLSRITILYDF
jgi:putative salt-induced outer membrane protein